MASARQRRCGEVIGDAVVEAHGVLGGAVASVPAAGLVFGIDGLAKQYLVAVRSGGAHHSFVQHPARDGPFFGEIGLDVRPFPAGFEDDDFASAIHFRQFRGTGVG